MTNSILVERQQVAELGRVDEVRRREHASTTGRAIAHGHCTDAIAVDVRRDRLVIEQDPQTAGADVGREHLLEHGQRDPRLVAEARDAAVARVEQDVAARAAAVSGK